MDVLNAVAVRPDGSILLAGRTDGVWDTSGNIDHMPDYAAVLLNASALSTPSPESTNSWTTSLTIVPSMVPTPAPRATQGPWSVLPSPTYSPQMGTSGPHATDASTKKSLGPSTLVGGVVGVAAVLVILVVLATRVRRRWRRDIHTGVRTFRSGPLHFPASAPPAGDGTPPSPPRNAVSLHFPAAATPADGEMPASPPHPQVVASPP